MHEKIYKNFLEINPYPRTLRVYDLNSPFFLNFSSNDYLGLSQHPLLIARSKEYAERYGVGVGSSRSVTGNLSLHESVEALLAKNMGKPAALIFGTGYQVNMTILTALFDNKIMGCKPLVFSDRHCHASMQSHLTHLVELKRFHHNDLNHLEALLIKFSSVDKPKYILIESIYSMDGDEADLKNIIFLARKYNAFLYVDDAHAVGVYGYGKASSYAEGIDIIMGSFSKALGSMGGYIVCSALMRDYLINKCKGLIYSTALPATIMGSMEAALELIPTLNSERERLFSHCKKLRQFFLDNELSYGKSSTHIIPWILGDAQKTLRASQLLEQEGIIGCPIRPPSVVPKQCLIRFAVSSKHSDEDLTHLLLAIKKINKLL